MKYLLTLIVLLAVAGASFAQLSLPNVTDSQFDRADGSVNDRPLILGSFADGLTKPGLSLQGSSELTIRQTQRRKGVLEDLHDNATSANALFAPNSDPHGFRAYLHGEHLTNSGTLNSGSTKIGLSGALNEDDIGLIWPIRHLTVRAGYEHDRYSAGGQSNVYANIFHIFPSEPPFTFDKTEDTGTLSLSYQIAPAWTAEIDTAEQGSPGTLALVNPSSPARFSIPVSDHGSSHTYALSYNISHQSTAFAFSGVGSYQGSGNVEREGGLVVGQSNDSRLARQTGLAWQRRFGGSRTLTLYGEEDQQNWVLLGTVPNPAQIGVTVSNAHDLAFGANYNLNTEIAGASWEERSGAGHSFYADIRYDEIKARISASEGLILFLFPAGQSSTENISGLNGYVLQLRYRFPIWRLQSMIGAAQVIPATSGTSINGGSSSSGSGAGGRGSPLGPRHTYGGYALTWQMGYEF